MENGIIHRYDPTPLIEERNEFVAKAENILQQLEELMRSSETARLGWIQLSDNIHRVGWSYMRAGGKDNTTPQAVIDGQLWTDYLKRTGLWDHLPDRYRQSFIDWRFDKAHEAPEFTQENVEQFVQQLHDTRWDWLSERILDAFGYASKYHKSNQAHKIGDKVILKGGFWHDQQRKVQGIESVVYHVMNDTVTLKDRLDTNRQAAGTTIENKYMKIKKFQNENVHITWTEEGKEAVRRMNEVLALGASRKLGR